MREERSPQNTRDTRQTDDAYQQDNASGFRRYTAGSARRGSGSTRRRPARDAQAAGDAQPEAGEPTPGRTGHSSDYLGVGDPCRVCGRPVDPTQTRCPHCGAFQRPLYTNPFFWGAVVIVVAIVVLLSIGINSCASKNAPEGGTGTTGNVPISTGGDQDGTSPLASAIASAQARIDENAVTPTYTAASIESLSAALATAQGVSSDPNATEDQVNQSILDISNALEGLILRPVAFGQSYEWPWYEDVVNALASDPSYVGTQIAMQGVISSVTSGTEESVALVAISGDPACMVQVTCTGLTEFIDTDLTEGNTVDFAGTVTGTTEYTAEDGTVYQIPTVTADFYQYSELY